MPTDLQREKRLAFWQIFGAGLLALTALLILGIAQEATLRAIFY